MAKTGVKKDNKTLDIKTVCECCHCLGSKTLHPQVSLINLEKPELEEDTVKFEFYAILLIEDCPTVVAVAAGSIMIIPWPRWYSLRRAKSSV